jgi:hypothetical protein
MQSSAVQLFRENFRPWWKVFVIVYMLAAIGLVVFWSGTRTGLFALFDGLFTHSEGDGRYEVHYPKIVFILTMLALMLPAIVLRFALGHRVRVHDPNNVMRL